MNDDLRTRIAAVLYRHAAQTASTEVSWLSWEDISPVVVREVWLAMADAVIEELGLEQEEGKPFYDGMSPGYVMHRYVTEWEADD